MYRVYALILAVVGLISPFGLNALLVCGSCPTADSVASCCEDDSAGMMPCCTDNTCETNCSGCVCAKRVDPPSYYPRTDREAEIPPLAILCVAALLQPVAVPEPGFGIPRRATESPPHLGALKTIRLAI
ncbi:MAG: hypothetical protein KF805_08675 [Phycisphaeraceae bacterium]|nr:hypothetical protein [Phycisphaeraceae bacterium]